MPPDAILIRGSVNVGASCMERLLPEFLGWTAVIGGLLVFGLMMQLSTVYWAEREREIQQGTGPKQSRLILVTAIGFGLFMGLTLGLVGLLGRSWTQFYATETQFVETGCRMGRSSDVVLDRAKTRVFYKNSYRKNGYRHEVVFVEGRKQRIEVIIDGENVAALRQVVPEVMRKFDAFRASH